MTDSRDDEKRSRIPLKNKSTNPKVATTAVANENRSDFADTTCSIADTIKSEPEAMIAEDVKFNNSPFEENLVKKKRSRTSEDDQERKRLEDEQYDIEIKEQRFKRLMHLLERSQFYSSYIFSQIGTNTKEVVKKSRAKAKTQTGDENAPPTKISKKNKNNYDVQEYISDDMKNKLKSNRRKMNLSQEELEKSLNEEPNKVDGEMKQNKQGSNYDNFVPPIYFNGTLRDYQIDGLHWLKTLHENGVNGILADEMGLGKTIQVIALFCYLIEKRMAGPYLIIAPLSTISNWLTEFDKFAPELPVVLFHGDPSDRHALRKEILRKTRMRNGFKTQPVVVTTYETPMMEKHFMAKEKWRYIVIDEGHRVKNPKCQLLGVLKSFQSMNRLLLTGTPLQNNLTELWSLLNFLLPEIFNDLALFESWFDVKELQNEKGTEKFLEQEKEKQVLSTLRKIFEPFMLRRVKADVCLDIPPKKEVIVYAPLTELQHDLYTAVLNRDLDTLSKIDNPDPVIPEVNGERPKRKCLMRNKYSSTYTGDTDYLYNDKLSRSLNSTNNDEDNEHDETWEGNTSAMKKELDIWKKFTDVTDRNREFLIRIQLKNRGVMYKKIVNHPYLVHCPLDASGLPKIDEDMIKSSGKLLVLDAMLSKLKAQGHKVLLFSTFTMILDMIEDYLLMRSYKFERLDGSDNIQARIESIKNFNSDPNIFIFIISTRAGGVGLNLAAADTVIIYDSDWNPQVDIQAMARCHRIGQTRPVVVYKLCTKGTIDEKIMRRAEAKRKLEKIVMSKKGINDESKINLMELKELLTSSDCQVATSANEIFTEKELDQLLDRSDLVFPNPTDL